jgi:hypothetical protein
MRPSSKTALVPAAKRPISRSAIEATPREADLTMPTATYALFRNAILGEQQVICSYDGRRRELCPHIIGTNKYGEEAVLAWQFAGESSGPLPQWRCLKLANVRFARTRDGEWFAGGTHQSAQTCVTDIDLDINVHVRKLR